MPSWVPWYRPPLRGGLAYEDWKDDASCNGLDVKLFELPDFEEVERGEGWEVIAEGLRVCSGCPVRAACKSNSTEQDRYWTTRGGQPPEGLFRDSKRPTHESLAGRVSSTVLDDMDECRFGHVNWKLRKNGKRFCETCRREQRVKRYARTGE